MECKCTWRFCNQQRSSKTGENIAASFGNISSIGEKLDKQIVSLENLKSLIEAGNELEPSEILTSLDNLSADISGLITFICDLFNTL